jgi:hypothetical protein
MWMLRGWGENWGWRGGFRVGALLVMVLAGRLAFAAPGEPLDGLRADDAGTDAALSEAGADPSDARSFDATAPDSSVDASVTRSSARRCPRCVECPICPTVPSDAELRNRPFEPAGAAGTLAFDELAGFRVTRAGGSPGLNYSGLFGVASNGGLSETRTAIRYTTLWLAPSIDYFVADQLSLGVRLDLALQILAKNDLYSTPGVATPSPYRLNLSTAARIGYLVNLSTRWAFWPKFGMGYADSNVLTATNNAYYGRTQGATYLEAEAAFLVRLSESLYIRMVPGSALILTRLSSSSEPALVPFVTVGFGAFL